MLTPEQIAEVRKVIARRKLQAAIYRANGLRNLAKLMADQAKKAEAKLVTC